MSRPVADVSVIVVCLNGLPWLERCLASVAGHETIVVDHGSTDGSVELVRRSFPEARLIEQGNVGMGGGNNAGMRIAGGRYFLLLERLLDYYASHAGVVFESMGDYVTRWAAVNPLGDWVAANPDLTGVHAIDPHAADD